MIRKLISIWLVVLPVIAKAQVPAPAPAQEKSVLIRYAEAHVGNGDVIENAYISFHNGELTQVMDANKSRISLSEYDTVIDADGLKAFPGFILMDSRLGLTEIDAVKATQDYDETGEFLPNISALPAYNAESKIIPTVRFNGVLMAQIAPTGGRISGMSSVVQFDAWNWSDAMISKDEGMYLNWSDRYQKTGWWASPGPVKINKKYQDQQSEVYDFFNEARSYAQLDSHKAINLRFESMRELFSGDRRLYIRVDKAKDMLDAIQFIRYFKLRKVTFIGASEVEQVLNEVKENDVSIIIDRVHQLPQRNEDPLVKPFQQAQFLAENEIPFAFATSGDMEAMISRNLPFQVGTAIHYGLDYEEAVSALTLAPARLLGIDTDYGTLEPGKKATFFLCSGDPFDPKSNTLVFAFIDGRMIALDSHQKQLYLKYARKSSISLD